MNESIENKDAFKIAKKGILQSPEGRMILRGLTVEGKSCKLVHMHLKALKRNLLMKKVSTKGLIKITKAERIKNAFDLVYGYFPVLKERRKTTSFNPLSGGEQQMLAIGRALMGSHSLLLGEPSLD